MIELDLGNNWEALGIRSHPGYTGAFTDRQADGAIPNGTRIVKVDSEPGDHHPNGATGRVLGSLRNPVMLPLYFYFVEWDASPRIAIGIIGSKIAPVTPS